MDQNSPKTRLKEYAWPTAIAIAVTLTALVVSAIVVKSPRLASPEGPQVPVGEKLATLETPAPGELGRALLAPSASAEAFTTLFFDANTQAVTLDAFKGQGIVLNFWATWCPPCVKEMPALDNLAAQLKGTGVRVIAVSEDRRALDLVGPFFTERGIQNLDIYFDVKSALSRSLDIEGLPTTLLIDANGREIGRVKGALEWDAAPIVEFLGRSLGPKP